MSHGLSKSPTRPKTPAIAALLLVALIVCAGCGQAGSPSQQGMSSVFAFPSDLTLYPNAKTPEGAPPGTITSLTTTDPVKNVMAFYEDQSKNGGWQKVSSESMGNAAKVTIKKDNRTVLLLLNSNGTETVVDITLP